jgi:hypothetical protein
MPHREPAAFVGGFDWVDSEGRSEAISLCRVCAGGWNYGTLFGPDELGTRLGAPVHWLR